MFKALVIDMSENQISSTVKELSEHDLPPGDVTIKSSYSTLNYKDGMILEGIGKLVSSYPHVPGVDVAGIVVDSSDGRFVPGDEVIVGGHRFGEIHWGGYSELVRVPGDWIVKLPSGLSLRQSMAFGTAGLSAMLALIALEKHGLSPSEYEVLVTGAVGGVGSIAVALLASMGYKVAASTGRSSEHDYLVSLGASSVVDRSVFEEASSRPLEKERWSGCIDNVGGSTLGRVLGQMCANASIASVGLAGGSAFSSNVMPFLLRGVNILGIDSVSAPMELRSQAWQRLAESFPVETLESVTSEISLQDLGSYGRDILSGKVKGRVVVRL